jgi:hypothetical protein
VPGADDPAGRSRHHRPGWPWGLAETPLSHKRDGNERGGPLIAGLRITPRLDSDRSTTSSSGSEPVSQCRPHPGGLPPAGPKRRLGGSHPGLVISDTIPPGEEVAHYGFVFRPHTTAFGRPGRGALRPPHGFGRLPTLTGSLSPIQNGEGSRADAAGPRPARQQPNEVAWSADQPRSVLHARGQRKRVMEQQADDKSLNDAVKGCAAVSVRRC